MKPRLWWIGVLFMVGSALFALGSAPFYPELVPPEVVGATFFAGSIFFTSASLLQLKQTPRVDRLDWWAAVVQFVGTIFFNVTTFAALDETLSVQEQDVRVWAPDALGSVCFLVASALALAPVWARAERAGGSPSGTWSAPSSSGSPRSPRTSSRTRASS